MLGLSILEVIHHIIDRRSVHDLEEVRKFRIGNPFRDYIVVELSKTFLVSTLLLFKCLLSFLLFENFILSLNGRLQKFIPVVLIGFAVLEGR